MRTIKQYTWLNPPEHSEHECPRVKLRVECNLCGYPASESLYQLPKEVRVSEIPLYNAG